MVHRSWSMVHGSWFMVHSFNIVPENHRYTIAKIVQFQIFQYLNRLVFDRRGTNEWYLFTNWKIYIFFEDLSNL